MDKAKRKAIIAGNWKMNKTPKEAKALLEQITPLVKDADCEVIALYVRYNLRNRGIGKRLMQYAFDRFRAEGRKKMIVWCLKENHESRKFYENVGGKEFRTGSHNWGGKDYEMISYLYDLA